VNKYLTTLIREAVEIRSQLVEAEEDGFIEEDCLIDLASPPIYDTYPNEEVSGRTKNKYSPIT
jgi:hypothetical protein